MRSSFTCFYTMASPRLILQVLLLLNVPVNLAYGFQYLPEILNGGLIIVNETAARVECAPGFTLVGSPLIKYDESIQWNDENDFAVLPQCMANDSERFKICHFELSEALHCNWQVTSSIYEWNVFSNYENSIFALRGFEFPYRDRTSSLRRVVMPAHYLLITLNGITSARPNPWIRYLPRLNKFTNEPELISPLFPANAESKEELCLEFYMYTMGPCQGSLKVRINEKIVWRNSELEKVYGFWEKVTIDLRNQTRNFRITFMGEPVNGDPLGMAVDDVQLLVGDSCEFPQKKGTEQSESVYAFPSNSAGAVSGFFICSLSLHVGTIFFIGCLIRSVLEREPRNIIMTNIIVIGYIILFQL